MLQRKLTFLLVHLLYAFIGLMLSACKSTNTELALQELVSNYKSCLPTQAANDEYFQAAAFGINLPAAKLATKEELANQISSEISSEILIQETNISGKVEVLFQSNTVMSSKKVPLDGFTFTGSCQGEGYAETSARLAKKALVKNLSLKLPTLWQEVDILEKEFNQLTPFQRIDKKEDIDEMLSDLLRIDELKKQYTPSKNLQGNKTKNNDYSSYFRTLKGYLFEPTHPKLSKQQLAMNKLLAMKAQTHLIINFSGHPNYVLLTNSLKQSLSDINIKYQEDAKSPVASMTLIVNEQINKHGNNNIVILDARFEIKLVHSDTVLTSLSLGRASGNSSLSVKSAKDRAQYQLVALVSKKINHERDNIKYNLGIKG